MKLCECGCGHPAPISNQTDVARGYVKGEPRRFVARHYKPARVSGYPAKRAPWHPKAHAGCVPEHVLVAERALGRYLPDGVEVHHVNEVKADNRNTNLVICQDKRYHKLLHVRARVVRAGGDANTERICSSCKRLTPIADFVKDKRNRNGGIGRICGACRREFNQRYVRPTKQVRRAA